MLQQYINAISLKFYFSDLPLNIENNITRCESQKHSDKPIYSDLWQLREKIQV